MFTLFQRLQALTAEAGAEEPGSEPAASVGGSHPATGAEGGEEPGQETPPASGQEGEGVETTKPTSLLGEASGEAGEEAAEGTDDGRPTYLAGYNDDGSEIRKPIPDQFWDADNGQVRHDALAKAWSDTRQALKQAKEQEGKISPPESPDQYPVDEAIPEGFELDQLDQEMLTAYRNSAHQAGLSEQQFQAFLADFMPRAKELDQSTAPDPEAEKAKLGDQADAIVNATAQWLDNLTAYGAISEDQKNELLFVGQTAEGVKTLDNIRRFYTGEQQIPTTAQNQDGLPSKEELYAKVRDERYQTDEAFRKQVDKEFQQVFGDAPAGSAPSGLGVR